MHASLLHLCRATDTHCGAAASPMAYTTANMRSQRAVVVLPEQHLKAQAPSTVRSSAGGCLYGLSRGTGAGLGRTWGPASTSPASLRSPARPSKPLTASNSISEPGGLNNMEIFLFTSRVNAFTPVHLTSQCVYSLLAPSLSPGPTGGICLPTPTPSSRRVLLRLTEPQTPLLFLIPTTAGAHPLESTRHLLLVSVSGLHFHFVDSRQSR
jgi:hypothetical protein